MNIRLIVTKLTNSSENATGNNKFKLLQVSFLPNEKQSVQLPYTAIFNRENKFLR